MAFIGTDSALLGAEVEHLITGETGLVTAKYYVVSGCCELLVNSKIPRPDGGFRDFYCSSAMVKVLNSEALPCEQFEERSGYDFCQEVEIPHIDVKGTITAFCFYMFNSDHVEVQPPYNHTESKKPSTISVATSLIKPINGVTPPLSQGAQRPSPGNLPSSESFRYQRAE